MLDAIALGELLIDFATVDTDRAGYPPLAAHPGGAGSGGKASASSIDRPSRTSSLASSPIQPSSGSGVLGRKPTACR